MDSLLYTTPSPVTAKRRLSSVPATRTGIGRQEIAVSEQVGRIQRDWPELLMDEGIRRASLNNSNEFLKHLKEEKDIGDSSMGFKELQRVRKNNSILDRSERLRLFCFSILLRLNDTILI